MQVASRDPKTQEFEALVKGERSDIFWIDLLYSDIESTQRLVTRFAFTLAPERSERITSVVRYWTLDGPDPHDSRGRLE